MGKTIRNYDNDGLKNFKTVKKNKKKNSKKFKMPYPVSIEEFESEISEILEYDIEFLDTYTE